MRRVAAFFALAWLVVSLPAALASHTPAPSAVTIAGSLQSELGCSGDWQPDCAATHLAFEAADEVWQGSFAVPAGTSVQAAAPGEVALISEALGGLGTIVLVRHRDDLITTYSTLSDVRVSEGEQVQAGQVLGIVAERENPELQFDVFRGTESVDPTPYIGG